MMSFVNGDKYAGQWQKDKQYGDGKMEYASKKQDDGSTGDVYEGQWKGNMRYGEGTLNYENLDRYKGGFKDDLRHGHGQIMYKSGEEYEGAWYKDKPDRDSIHEKADADAINAAGESALCGTRSKPASHVQHHRPH